MPTTKVITIETVDDAEYGGKDYKKVMDTQGLYYNIKQGREGKLKAKWELLKPGVTIELIYGGFNNKEGEYKKFVQDIELVAEASEHIDRPTKTNASIESQVAIKEIGLDWREGKLPDDSFEVKVYRDWLKQRLGIDTVVIANQAKQSPVVKEAIKMGAKLSESPGKQDSKSPKKKPASLAEVSELLKWAQKERGLSDGDMNKLLGINNIFTDWFNQGKSAEEAREKILAGIGQ